MIKDRMIVGLYSFPKSGNTWIRSIIASMFEVPQGKGMLQKYITDTHFSKIIENPWNYGGKDWYFYKSHHKTPIVEEDGDIIINDKIIYIYRHPLDVFISYLNFMSKNVSPRAGKAAGLEFSSVEDLKLGEMDEIFNTFLTYGTIVPKNKKFGGIFEHIENYLEMNKNDGESVLILRYEDLISNFNVEVLKIANFLEISDINIDRIFTQADQMTQKNGKFFWKRVPKNYENYLTKRQIEKFLDQYEGEMIKIGYLS